MANATKGTTAVDMTGSESGMAEAVHRCEHVKLHIHPMPSGSRLPGIDATCTKCGNERENWICLTCYRAFCGRFASKHMVEHSTEAGHLIAMSTADLSFWCYACDSYLHHLTQAKVWKVYAEYHLIKFGEAPPVTPTDAELGITADEAAGAAGGMTDDTKITEADERAATASAAAAAAADGTGASKSPDHKRKGPAPVDVSAGAADGKSAAAATPASPPSDTGAGGNGYDYGSHSDTGGSPTSDPDRTQSQESPTAASASVAAPAKKPAAVSTAAASTAAGGGAAGGVSPIVAPAPDTKRRKVKGAAQSPVSPEAYAAQQRQMAVGIVTSSAGAKAAAAAGAAASAAADAKSKTPPATSVDVTGLTAAQHNDPIINKILGCLYGNALGDAYGLSTEFMDREDIQQVYGDNEIPFPDFARNAHNSRWSLGDWTDDTDQMILIMETLIEAKGVDIKKFALKLRNWINNGFPDLGDFGGMGLGATVSAVCRHKNFLSDPHSSSKLVCDGADGKAAANGAVMRTSVLGCFEYSDMKKVVFNTEQIAKVTHWDPRCVASCVLVTTVIASILQDKPHSTEQEVEQLIAHAHELTSAYLTSEREKAEYKAHVFPANLSELKLDDAQKIGYTLKCLGAGLYGLRASAGNGGLSFQAALQKIAREGGDSDTNGAVAGAMWGVARGYRELPVAWLLALPNRRWFDMKIVALLGEMKLIPSEQVTRVLAEDAKLRKAAAAKPESDGLWDRMARGLSGLIQKKSTAPAATTAAAKPATPAATPKN